jgi:hypothetical protein
MGMLEILANSQNRANENFLNSVERATGAWGGLMDNLTYKAAGNELIALMQTKPVDQEIEPMDIIKVAQKYRLPQEKMMNLLQMMETSGALRAAQQQRRLAAKEAAAKERLVDETGLPSDVSGDIVKASAKPVDLSYHIEKEQLGNQKIQDYRVFTDKSGNVVKREPIGAPYANTEGVANVRVQAFGSVPTSTPGIGYDRVNKKWFETDEDGNRRDLSSEQVRGKSLLYREQIPTNDIKVMQQSVPSVKQLSRQVIAAIDSSVESLGPMASRWRDAWSGKIGASDPEFRKLTTAVNLLQTRLMKMHVGARGGEYIMKHFQEIIDAGKDSPENLKAAIEEIIAYADEVGMTLDQQRIGAGMEPSIPQVSASGELDDPLGIR